jgi:hypothetical protein
VFTPFPTDAVTIAGLESVGKTTRTSRAVSFTQRVVATGTISWRLDISFYISKNLHLEEVSPHARAGARPREAQALPHARLVLRTALRLANGPTIHATKTSPGRREARPCAGRRLRPQR